VESSYEFGIEPAGKLSRDLTISGLWSSAEFHRVS
jgi:hypothetical protein